MWLDGVKVQNLTNQPDKMWQNWSFPTKITSQRRASSFTKNVGILPKKTKAFLPFHQSNELSKNTGILTNLVVFWQSCQDPFLLISVICMVASWFDRHPFTMLLDHTSHTSVGKIKVPTSKSDIKRHQPKIFLKKKLCRKTIPNGK